MSKRPSRLLAWAYDAISGAVVEPPGGLSAAGWVKDTRPPAPYMNFLFNVAASWINFLRGPNIANWSRATPITAFSDTTNIPRRIIAVDTVTHDGDTAAWRYVAVGNGTGGDPARQIWCSRRGDAWVRRTNLPVGVDGPLVGCAFVSASTGWVCWTTGGSGDGQIFFTAAGNSGAVGTDGVDWTASTLPGGAADVVGVVGCNASRIAAITADDILTSTDGAANFTAATLTGSFTGDGLDIVWSGQSFVALTSNEIFRSSNNVSATWARSTLPETSTRHRLATDGAGTVCVYAAGESTVQNLLVSTDHGATWDTVPGATGMKNLKHIAYGDGVWIASSSVAPYLWQSNDLVKWVRLAPPVVESGNLAPLGAVYADARWLAVGNGFMLSTLRGVDPTPGAFVPNDDAPVVADAGYLRGRKVSTTAPTDTQTLAWNASTSVWEPTDASGGSSATHGAGTLVARPASPVAGDSYVVTSGPGKGRAFECRVDGAWSLVPVPPGLVNALASSTGWTLTPAGGGAAGIASNVLTLDVPTSSSSESLAVYAAFPTYPKWRAQWSFSLNVRGSSNLNNIRLRHYFCWNAGYSSYRQIDLSGDATLAMVGAGATLSSVALDGTGWVRVECDAGGQVSFWYGTSSGDTPPTSWTMFCTSAYGAFLAGLASPTRLEVHLLSETIASSDEITATVSNFTIEALD